jgi:hypothetical protein
MKRQPQLFNIEYKHDYDYDYDYKYKHKYEHERRGSNKTSSSVDTVDIRDGRSPPISETDIL